MENPYESPKNEDFKKKNSLVDKEGAIIAVTVFYGPVVFFYFLWNVLKWLNIKVV